MVAPSVETKQKGTRRDRMVYHDFDDESLFLIQKCLIAITFRESKFLITSLLSIFFIPLLVACGCHKATFQLPAFVLSRLLIHIAGNVDVILSSFWMFSDYTHSFQ